MKSFLYWAKAFWFDIAIGTTLISVTIFEPPPAYGTRALCALLIFWRVAEGLKLAIEKHRLDKEIVRLKANIKELDDVLAKTKEITGT